ncbi:hypothetical protein AVJ23_18900 [Pseudoponticoccus marisrubri]|uniref:Uncharacterized protein n=2 Tax=Pseudoponticoccus marisrubri TaxID=1685382 RepID=A0A0W7WF00_9RHOB|nr:hypothetical protein AVJ23_18900 [Pseudoponticoccus marisrubri]
MQDPTTFRAAIAILAILQTVMLGALFAGVPPHPPVQVAPFGIGPFLGASLAICAAAWMLASRRRPALLLGGAAIVAALVSFGPQKYFDPQFPLIWPAVLIAQAAIATLLVQLVALPRTRGVPA